jgi:HAD superfamily hydrolase (TIGR01549 family)
MIHGVFFDLYGTLIIYGDMQAAVKDLISSLHRAIINKGAAMSTEMLTSYYQSITSRPPQPNMDGTSRFERQLDDICREVGVKLNDYEICELADQCVGAWSKYTRLDPESIPVLKKLHQSYKIGLITNFDYPPHIKRLLREAELSPLFDVTLISDMVGVSKPDRRIFELALTRTDLKPANVVFVGDSLEDIQGALGAGMLPVYIQRPSAAVLDLSSLSGTKVITQLSELPAWLASIDA